MLLAFLHSVNIQLYSSNNIDANARKVIDLLRAGPTFDKSTFAKSLASYLYFEGPLVPHKKYVPENTYPSPSDGFLIHCLAEEQMR